MARKLRINHVQTQIQASVDLGDADGKVALTMRVPGDGARVLDFKLISTTAGTGAAANHNCTIERVSDNADLTEMAALDADATAEASGVLGAVATGNGLLVQPALTMGELIQIDNVESAAISNGAIVTAIVRWEL